MTDAKPVVVVGSINMDLVSGAERIPRAGETVTGTVFATYPGGKGANQAVAAARLGFPVRMIGCVGEDSFGAGLRAGLEQAGVDVSAVETVSGASGIASIVVSEIGENTIVVIPGANAAVTVAMVERYAEAIREASCVLLQLEIPLETVLHVARMCDKAGVPVILDPAPAAALPAALFGLLTWMTPNETEAAFYAPDAHTSHDAVVALRKRGARNVLLKLGEQGAYVASGPVEWHAPSHRVQAVDSTAAGDCFNGAFAAALGRGMEPIEAAEFACAAAALSVTEHGAQASMPTLDAVHALMSQANRRFVRFEP